MFGSVQSIQENFVLVAVCGLSYPCVFVAIAMKLSQSRRTTCLSSGLRQCVGGWDMNVLVLLRSLTCDPVLSSQRWGLAVVGAITAGEGYQVREGRSCEGPRQVVY